MTKKKRSRYGAKTAKSSLSLSPPWWPPAKTIEPMRQSPLPIPGYAAVLILTVATLTLNIVGLRWGLPNHSSWNSDSIAGTKTVRMIPRLYKSWRIVDQQGKPLVNRQGKPIVERYPRAQFLITGNIYKPFLAHWQRNPIQVWDPALGKTIRTWYSIERISKLILVSRIVTVIMAIGAVLGVFATTRLLTRDSLAGFLAALVLMLSAEFTYFSHLGNLDTPVTFWFVWTGYMTLRALQTARLRYFILMGLFAGMVVCTKDPSTGHLAALVLFVISAGAYHHYKRQRKLTDEYKVVTEPGLWLALVCFVVVFILMNNVITDWPAFTARIEHWAGVKKDYVGDPGQQWRLIKKAVNCFRFNCGLWMFIALICSLIYCSIRHPLRMLWAIGPFVMFHIMITTQALQVQPRYHLPSLACLAALFGMAGSDLLRAKRIALALRMAPLCLVLILAAMYAVAVDAEMVSESRYRAEQWIRENIDKQKDAITFISPSTYMPRSAYEGYQVKYSFSDKTTEKALAEKPKLIALSEMWYKDPLHFDQPFRKKLLREQLAYRKIAEFEPKFTNPGKGPFAVATMTTRRYQVLSPKIVFMERVD